MDLNSRLQPVVSTAEETARTVDSSAAYPTATVAALRESGLLGLTLSPDVGGLGGGPKEHVEVASSLASVCGSTAMIYLMHVSAAMTVAAAPPPAWPDLLPSHREVLEVEVLGRWVLPEPAGYQSLFAAEQEIPDEMVKRRADSSLRPSPSRARTPHSCSTSSNRSTSAPSMTTNSSLVTSSPCGMPSPCARPLHRLPRQGRRSRPVVPLRLTAGAALRPPAGGMRGRYGRVA